MQPFSTFPPFRLNALALFGFLVLGLIAPVQAQPPGGDCTPNQNACNPPSSSAVAAGADPACFSPADQVLEPAAPGATGYESSIPFVVTETNQITAVRVDSVKGLPGSLTAWFVSGNTNDSPFSSDDLPGTFSPVSTGQSQQVFGCITVYGDIPPQFQDGDNIQIEVFFFASAGAFSQVQQETLTVPIQSVTGRNEAAFPGGEVQLFPNPSRGNSQLRFHLDQPETVRLRVFNAAGQAVHEQAPAKLGAGSHQFELPSAPLPGGLYTVQLQAGSGSLSRRLLIRR